MLGLLGRRPAWVTVGGMAHVLQDGGPIARADPPERDGGGRRSLLDGRGLDRAGLAEDGLELLRRQFGHTRAATAVRSCTSSTRRPRSSGSVSGNTPLPRLKMLPRRP